jgi:hypothetical protein
MASALLTLLEVLAVVGAAVWWVRRGHDRAVLRRLDREIADALGWHDEPRGADRCAPFAVGPFAGDGTNDHVLTGTAVVAGQERPALAFARVVVPPGSCARQHLRVVAVQTPIRTGTVVVTRADGLLAPLVRPERDLVPVTGGVDQVLVVTARHADGARRLLAPAAQETLLTSGSDVLVLDGGWVVLAHRGLWDPAAVPALLQDVVELAATLVPARRDAPARRRLRGRHRAVVPTSRSAWVTAA